MPVERLDPTVTPIDPVGEPVVGDGRARDITASGKSTEDVIESPDDES